MNFSLEGLESVTKHADVQLSQTARAGADLKVAAIGESIVVSATTPTVLETSQVASNIKADLVDRLLSLRDPLTAAALAPGVNTNTLSTRQLSISGGPGDANLILVNGVGAKTLILGGIAGNICILFSANDAYVRDFNIIVPRDCVASNTKKENDNALDQIKKVLKGDVRLSARIRFPKA